MDTPASLGGLCDLITPKSACLSFSKDVVYTPGRCSLGGLYDTTPKSAFFSFSEESLPFVCVADFVVGLEGKSWMLWN